VSRRVVFPRLLNAAGPIGFDLIGSSSYFYIERIPIWRITREGRSLLPALNIFHRKTGLISLLLCLSLAAGACSEEERPLELTPPPSGEMEVLFIGSSYFAYNDLPGMFENLAEAAGREVFVMQVVPLGTLLDYHASSSTTTSMINSRNWDLVILQGVGRIVAYPGDADFDMVSVLQTLERTIHNNCGSTEVMFCMPWAFEDGMLWTAGGTDDYFAMQRRIYDNTLTYPDQVDIVISPVGWAWNSIMLEQPPQHYLFESDWNHPSARGSYLSACVIYSSVFRESVEGNPFHAGLPADEAGHFQGVASEIVMDGLDLWRLEQEDPGQS